MPLRKKSKNKTCIQNISNKHLEISPNTYSNSRRPLHLKKKKRKFRIQTITNSTKEPVQFITTKITLTTHTQIITSEIQMIIITTQQISQPTIPTNKNQSNNRPVKKYSYQKLHYK